MARPQMMMRAIGEELKHHEDVLHHRTLTNAADVDEREEQNGAESDGFLRELSHGHHA